MGTGKKAGTRRKREKAGPANRRAADDIVSNLEGGKRYRDRSKRALPVKVVLCVR